LIRGNLVKDRPIETGNGGEGICVKDACRKGVVEGNLIHHLYRLGIYNNVCSDNLNWQIATVPLGSHLTVTHNLLDACQGWVDGDFVEITGSHVVSKAPRFISVQSANYRLRPGSPAIDAGYPGGAPALDFDGRPRLADGNADGAQVADLGAFEFIPPRISWISLADGVAKLVWDSVPGATYSVEGSPTLVPPAWSIPLPEIVATGLTVEMADPSGPQSGQRFYRVRMWH
jgi:hypothetical protein